MNILGIGELVVDAIYLNDILLKYDGGGTVFNVIYNLKSSGNKLYVGGPGGNDDMGSYCISDLNKNGINTELIKTKKSKTRMVSTIISEKNETINSVKCLNCDTDTWSSSAKNNITIEDLKKHNIQMVIFDSLKNENIDLARECKKNGIVTVLDWGIIGNLRYLPMEKIIEFKNIPFDIIQINGRVASFVKSRLDIKSDKELFEYLNLELLIITYGQEGSFVISKEFDEKLIFTVDEVLDNNGAGDAFLAAALESYVEKNIAPEFIQILEIKAKAKVKNVLSTYGSRHDSKGFHIENENCVICGREKKTKKVIKKKKLESAIKNISTRLDNSMKSTVFEDTKSFKKKLKGNILIIGQGASYISANYLSNVISENSNFLANASFTNEIYDLNLNNYNHFLILSASGTSPDTKNAIEYLKENNVESITLLTSKTKSSFTDIDVISYYNELWTRERGFLSIESIILPALYFTSVFCDTELNDLFDIIKNNTEESVVWPINLSDKNSIDIFYEYNNKAVALDLESKFIESGLARVVLHEKKNFSHGRFSIIKKFPPDLVIVIENKNDKYEKKLFQYFSNKNIQTISIDSDFEDVNLKRFELLSKNLSLVNFISKNLKIDLSDPGYDKEDAKLYKHK